MKYDETWAVDITRIERFFLSMENAEKTAGDLIRCCKCSVKLTALSGHAVGPVEVPRTRVEITGEEAAAKELYRRFFLRFISAGG